RAWDPLRQEGERVNHNRIYRLWRREGLSLRKKTRRRRKPSGERRLYAATRPRQVWTDVFSHDGCLHGRKLRVLSVLDEFTRECLALAVDTRRPATRVKEVLARLFGERGAPAYLRSDNGPEFIDRTLQRWIGEPGTSAVHIEPGCPWQNG